MSTVKKFDIFVKKDRKKNINFNRTNVSLIIYKFVIRFSDQEGNNCRHFHKI